MSNGMMQGIVNWLKNKVNTKQDDLIKSYLEAGTDLNDITTTGLYIIGQKSLNIQNLRPSIDSWGYLKVFRYDNNGYPEEEGLYVTQEICGRDVDVVYRRKLDGFTWSEWKCLDYEIYELSGRADTLENKVGNTDISSIGDGTVTGGLSTLNSNIQKIGTRKIICNVNSETTITENLNEFQFIIVQGSYLGLNYSASMIFNIYDFAAINAVDVYIGSSLIGNITNTALDGFKANTVDENWHVHVIGVY